MSIYEDIKRSVSMKQVIAFLGLKGKFEQQDQHRGPCPVCKPDGRRELSINTSMNVFRCFAAPKKTAGDVIALTAHIRGIGQKEAAELLQEQFRLQDGIAILSKRTNAERKSPESKGRSGKVVQLIPREQLKPANDDRPERDPTDYTDLL